MSNTIESAGPAWGTPRRVDLSALAAAGNTDAYLSALIDDLIYKLTDPSLAGGGTEWTRIRVDRLVNRIGDLAVEWGFVHGEVWAKVMILDHKQRATDIRKHVIRAIPTRAADGGRVGHGGNPLLAWVRGQVIELGLGRIGQ